MHAKQRNDADGACGLYESANQQGSIFSNLSASICQLLDSKPPIIIDATSISSDKPIYPSAEVIGTANSLILEMMAMPSLIKRNNSVRQFHRSVTRVATIPNSELASTLKHSGQNAINQHNQRHRNPKTLPSKIDIKKRLSVPRKNLSSLIPSYGDGHAVDFEAG
ncbi:hypothetical protein SADUNF_Sadunf03G0078100 [Salix dunnii]|uniref:Uncharacterized protein n=1 Tax=Salix dunnii TaxID=1413687 RepID=A0A835KGG2_9ROSI|nr:hypothetical protein SADUNF_Sadunf03G0078100 [Salix dunnii]